MILRSVRLVGYAFIFLAVQLQKMLDVGMNSGDSRRRMAPPFAAI